MRFPRHLRVTVLVGSLFLLLGACVTVLRTLPGPLRVVALDVGQGDAIFIETPYHQQMLIDGGPSNAVLDRLGRAMPFGDRSLDVVVLTHPDADHLTGVIGVLQHYHVGLIVATGVPGSSATYAAFTKTLRTQHVPERLVQAGDALTFTGGIAFTIFAPTAERLRTEKQANNTSIIGRLSYRDFSMLFPGDVEATVERELLANHTPLASTVFKVPHHGSHTSSTEAFLLAVHPELAVISVGKDNRFGHPHGDVLERYRRLGIPVERTDYSRDIMLTSNGATFRVRNGLFFRLW